MLQHIRDNSKGWIAKTIIGLIVVFLSFTGFDAIFNMMRTDQLAAKVGDTKITKLQVDQEFERYKRGLSAISGYELNEEKLRSDTLKNIIASKAILQYADKMDFHVTKEMLDKIIVSIFQQDGKFSQEMFDQQLRSLGYSRIEYRNLLADEIAAFQLQNSIKVSGFATNTELKNLVRREKQTRDFDFFLVKANPAAINVTDEQLQEYYTAHLADYIDPEQVIAEYIYLNKQELAKKIAVSDEQLQQAYQEQIANLKEQRTASHILLEVNNERTQQQAIDELTKIAVRIKNGEDFAKVAQEVSEDLVTAKNGGDLGLISLGQQDKSFEDALFNLPAGGVSEPVVTTYGVHLIKVNQIIKPEIPTFAELKDSLQLELTHNLVELRFVELSKELDALAFESSDLQQPATQLDLSVKESTPIVRADVASRDDIFSNPAAIKALFSDEVLKDGANSALIELDENSVAVVRVKEHHPAAQLEFAKVKSAVITDVKNHRAALIAQEQATDLVTKVKNGEKVDIDWRRFTKLNKRSSTSMNSADADIYDKIVASEVTKKVFALPKPKDGVPTVVLFNLAQLNNTFADYHRMRADVPVATNDVVVIRLNKVNEFTGELSEADIAPYRRTIEQVYNMTEWELFTESLVKAAKITYY